jgi:CDP-4-dehydro-6-deoxyglucose reductase
MSSAVTNISTPRATAGFQVKHISPLSEATFEVELCSTTDAVLDYRAGQYLRMEVDVNGDGRRQSLSYSIANSFNSSAPRRLQLFIHKQNALAGRVLDHLSSLSDSNTELMVTLPMGKAFLQTDLNLPHLLVAAGSGISKIKCLTEQILKQQSDAEVRIYWSNRCAADFYLLERFQSWADQHRHVGFIPLLESEEAHWRGRTGYLYEVIQQDISDLSDTRAYLCGSPQMVYGTIDKLQARGLQEEHCYSDVFEYAPRKQTLAG